MGISGDPICNTWVPFLACQRRPWLANHKCTRLSAGPLSNRTPPPKHPQHPHHSQHLPSWGGPIGLYTQETRLFL